MFRTQYLYAGSRSSQSDYRRKSLIIMIQSHSMFGLCGSSTRSFRSDRLLTSASSLSSLFDGGCWSNSFDRCLSIFWMLWIINRRDWEDVEDLSCINSKTCLSFVACVITNTKSPLLFTIKDPSPSVKPINQVKKFSEGILLFGKWILYFL